MEQNLQAVLDRIHADTHLSEDEKAVIIASLNEADKKMRVDAFRIERVESLKKTMSVLLDETIEELEHKRKAVEEKNRDLEIEASLERVRSRTMAMQRSEELAETVFILFQQFKELGENPDQATIGIINEEEHVIEYWVTMHGSQINKVFKFSIDEPNVTRRIYDGWRAQRKSLMIDLSGQELYDFTTYRASMGGAGFNPVEKRRVINVAFFSKGIINVQSTEARSAESIRLLERFAGVFEGTYTRFLDLKKAEAQVKESQIELALERVRARTMAMYHSEELAETASVLFQQLSELGNEPARISIGIMDREKGVVNFWATDQEGGQININFTARIDEKTTISKMYAGWQAKLKSLSIELKGKELAAWVRFCREEMGIIIKDELLQKRRVHTVGYFSHGWINYTTHAPLSLETTQILERFATMFSYTYTRFLDLQKAEAQVREAKIEAALERTRTQSMLMQHSNELDDTLRVFHQQVLLLGIQSAFSFLWLPDEEKDRHIFWAAWAENNSNNFKSKAIDYPLDRNEPATAQCLVDWKGNEPVVSYHVPPDGVKSYFAAWQELIDGVEQLKPEYFRDGLYYVEAFIKYGCFGVMVENPLTEEEKKILGRLAIEFERTYTRFLDLQKAEAQAREAQIELSLERVRAKTMAMHNSQDVGDTVATMFDELVKLGIENTARCGIAIISDKQEMELWRASYNTHGEVDMLIGRIDMTIHPLLKGVYQAWKNKQTAYFYELTGEDLETYFRALNNSPDYAAQFDLAALPEKQTNNVFFFPEGCVYVFTLEPLPEEATKLVKRFAGVFGLTYRRYLDLQKAEKQARQAQIEVALERVRSRTMGMQHSEELATVIQVLYEQLVQLGFEISNAGFLMDFWETDDFNLWMADAYTEFPTRVCLPYIDHPQMNCFKEAKAKGLDFVTCSLTLEEKNRWFEYCFTILDVPEETQPLVFDSPGLATSAALLKHVSLYLLNYANTPYSEAENATLMRFGKVFEQIYTRFNDLKLAEEQAREAKIEAALEKVRGKAMAMYNSNDLSSTASMVFTELRKLGISPLRCGVGIASKDSRKVALYSATTTTDGDSLGLMGWVVLSGHPVLEKINESILSNEDYFPVLKGKQLKSYYDKLLSGLSLPSLPDFHTGEEQYGHFFPFQDGCLYAWAEKSYVDQDIKILKRFTSVIDLTFRRYIELQKSESSAREAVRQASLDRVRAEIASMRSTSDLERITPLIWNELTILGIPFIRCGVFIIDEQEQLIHTHLSTADGKALATFNLQFDSEGIGQNVLPAWRNKQIATIHWSADEFAAYTKNMVDQGTVKSQERYVTEHPDTSLDLHFLPFLQGMLYVGNIAPLTDEDMNLVQSLADAFSTAYARYEDFNKLEAAKQQVENTLTDLKAAQTKLIQSEKMASLGELTAGIAHEIQNPLNFVNNFSEVNQEMIDELEEELKAGNIDEALAIAADIKQNEEKISHHGKRADGIVKGMLQHSRSGGGEKQLTNINVLADEFLRLSYHGLRAKDKVFNAEMITHFDPDLPQISVIPQDMGRVMLNLFNNAFYAVQQKHKTAGDGYKPTIEVTSFYLPLQGVGGLKVRDNGIGIPDAIKEKIMQPFFTTKPTGEGTGLGLSLTYDMVVKGHGGSIQVNSVEGEGSEFTIQLPIN